MNTEDFRIDTGSPIPLYYQIRENLRELIVLDELSPGDTLPSERELAEIYGVSRLTVRQAITELVREGLLKRQQGVGTFVAQPKLIQALPKVMGFTERMLQAGRVPSSQLIELTTQPTSKRLAHRLNISPDAQVVKLVRLRLANGEPVMLETAYLPYQRFPNLLSQDFEEGSLYETLTSKYDVRIAEAEEVLEPVLLTQYEADLLGTQEGTPALLVEVMAYADDGQPIEFSKSIVRGDKSRYYFRIKTQGGTKQET